MQTSKGLIFINTVVDIHVLFELSFPSNDREIEIERDSET